MTGLNVANQVH